MPSLRDQSFNASAWTRLGMVGLGLAAVGLLIYFSVQFHRSQVQVPRLLEQRHSDPVGKPGMSTLKLAHYGPEVVDTLIADFDSDLDDSLRLKSLEILSAIDDPRVAPTLTKALQSPKLSVKIAALAGITRTRDPQLLKELWPMINKSNSYLRQRVIVAIGLMTRPSDHERLLKLANSSAGQTRLLFAWALGYSALRSQLNRAEKSGVAPLKFKDQAHIQTVQTEVDELRAALLSKPVETETAERFAKLVTVDFSVWNVSHQLSYQTLALAGPARLSGVSFVEQDDEEAAAAKPLPRKRPKRTAPF